MFDLLVRSRDSNLLEAVEADERLTGVVREVSEPEADSGLDQSIRSGFAPEVKPRDDDRVRGLLFEGLSPKIRGVPLIF